MVSKPIGCQAGLLTAALVQEPPENETKREARQLEICCGNFSTRPMKF